MGFSRFLQNKPLNLSGIKQFTPDLTQAEKTLESITSGYDEVQALSNAIPEYMQGDSERMRAKQDEYRAGIQNTADAFANQGAQAGNALLRNMKSIIQSDFSTTGEVYGMGNNFKQRQVMKDQLIANKVPSELAKAYLDKNVPASSFDADGKFQRYEAGVAPTVPNYAEIAINAASNMLPDKSLIEEIITDENGIPTHIKQVGKDIVKIADIKSALADVMESHPEVQNSREAFGDVIDTKIAKAISGASKMFSKDDETLKYRMVAGGGKKGKTKTKTKSNSNESGIIYKKGNPLIVDLGLATEEEFQTNADGELDRDEDGNITSKKLDYTKTEDTEEIYKNLESAIVKTADVENDIIAKAGDNVAEKVIASIYVKNNNFTEGYIEDVPSEYFLQGVTEDPNSQGAYASAIKDYAIAKAMQDRGLDDNFLYTDAAVLNNISTSKELNDLFIEKTKDKTEEEVNALLSTYNEQKLGEEFNRSLDKLDKPANNRNRVVKKKELWDKKIETQLKESFTEAELKAYEEGLENLTPMEAEELSKTYSVGKPKAKGSKTKQDYQIEIDALLTELEEFTTKVRTPEERAEGNIETIINIQQEKINKLVASQLKVKDREFSPKELKQLKSKMEADNTEKSKEFKFNAAQDLYKANHTVGQYSLLTYTNGIPDVGHAPDSNAKMNTASKVEYNFAYQVSGTSIGTAKAPKWESNPGVEFNTYISYATGKPISEEVIKEKGIVGIQYAGFIRDAAGAYQMTGRLRHADGSLSDKVRVANPEFDKQFRATLYGGHPLKIKEVIDPLLDDLELNPDGIIVDKAILGHGFTLQVTKSPNGRNHAYIKDSITGKTITGGKLEFKDAYDLSDQIGGIIDGEIAVSYDQDLKWEGLTSYEKEGFKSPNIVFSKTEPIERKALETKFGYDFNEVFGSLKSQVVVTSMLRSLDNQRKLNESYNIYKDQYNSGHLFGLGIDVEATTELLNELKASGLDVEKAKEKDKYVSWRGFRINIHGKDGKLHLDIKK